MFKRRFGYRPGRGFYKILPIRMSERHVTVFWLGPYPSLEEAWRAYP